MRDVLKSALGLSWATSCFGAAQVARLLGADGRAAAGQSFEAVARAAAQALGAGRDETAQAGDNGSIRGQSPQPATPHPSPLPASGARETHTLAPERGEGRVRGHAGNLTLDTRRVIVLGEGLAAGVGGFAWDERSQRESFAAQAARQMGAAFPIPYLQAPGLYGAPGLPAQPVILPHLLQTTVVGEFPARRRFHNLALPAYELRDCHARRPVPPIVHRDDPRQTAANLVLGLAALTTDGHAARETQLEYAIASNPSLAIVELGYAEALRLALSDETGAADGLDTWEREYEQVIRLLRGCGAEVVVMTVPDPADTAGCLTLDAAARALRCGVRALQARYGLAADDSVTVAGLTRAAFQILGGQGGDLDSGGIVSAARRRAVSDRVTRMNAAIARTTTHGTHVFDLHSLFRSVRERGIDIGGRWLTADFLGGFYTLNGVYPGATGHAAIANGLIACVNEAFGASFPPIDIGRAARTDPVVDYRGAGGGERSITPATPSKASGPAGREAPRRRAAAHASPSEHGPGAALPLRLPPTLEMTVPLSRAGSYHGDAIRIVDARDEADARFGGDAGVLFGGHVLFDSNLSGALRITFTPPRGHLTRFDVSFDPLAGDDGVLSAPMFFRWPVQQCRVVCEPRVVSGGTLNLATGEVTDLSLSVRYLNSALQALVGVNPGFPDQPITFPGQYGSAWAAFEPRRDGRLDFTFYGSTFLPLGARFGDDAVRWALPFAGASPEFASIPARGMALHPHLHLSTRDPDPAPMEPEASPRPTQRPIVLPSNTISELTLFTRRSSFGDRFTLNTPELGGPATGRSHLLGRLLVQTGEPFGSSMPVAVWLMPPGGLLGQQPPSPLAALFPSRLSPGAVGHDEHLRFPIRNYFLDAVTLVDDPFDLSAGVVDLQSGSFVNQLLHRGFIGQDLFFSLIRVEPRTPQASFLFRGPAAFEQDADGRLTFRHRAIVHIPYPAGFAFPAPDLTSAITVGDASALDPYLWLRATAQTRPPGVVSARRDRVRSSTGEEFSYRFELPEEAARPLTFEYINYTLGGTFRIDAVSWLGRARVPTPSGETDVFTFSGFGRWSKDPTGRAHQAAVQIALGAEEYVSIQIDGGLVSNVNTRPEEEVAALP